MIERPREKGRGRERERVSTREKGKQVTEMIGGKLYGAYDRDGMDTK